jgi:hypothetical protein
MHTSSPVTRSRASDAGGSVRLVTMTSPFFGTWLSAASSTA